MLSAKPEMMCTRATRALLLLCLAGGGHAQAAVTAAPDAAATAVLSVEKADEAEIWLQKMRNALRHESYEGIFTYMRGYQFDTVQVAHEFRDGQEFERLSHLNGEPRELIRAGDNVVCNHGSDSHIDMEHEILMGPFTRAFSEKLSRNQSFYQISVLAPTVLPAEPRWYWALRLKTTTATAIACGLIAKRVFCCNRTWLMVAALLRRFSFLALISATRLIHSP